MLNIFLITIMEENGIIKRKKNDHSAIMKQTKFVDISDRQH